jgi:hypothetical protein
MVDIPEAKDYIAPQAGFQQKVLACGADVIFNGGGAGAGKTYANLMKFMYGFEESNYRGVALRNTLKDTKSQGGLVDSARGLFPESAGTWRDTDPAEFRCKSGATIQFNHLQNQNMEVIEQIWKGRQITTIYIDEITGIEFPVFAYLFSRNRTGGKCSVRPQFLASCNPSSAHWIRIWLDWYIGEDGFIRPDRDGKIRYFYISGKTVESVIWGDTREEVYEQSRDVIKAVIDKMKKKTGLVIDPMSFIKSFTFLEGVLAENKALIGDDQSYFGSLTTSGDAITSQLLLGNWNVSSGEDDELVSVADLDAVLENPEPQIAKRKCMTIDAALKGDDAMVIYVWQGFHLIDIEVIAYCESDVAIAIINRLKKKHGIPDKMIVYDDNGSGSYLSGFFKGAYEFLNNGKVENSENYKNLKSQCADKWAKRIKEKGYSFDRTLVNKNYKVKGVKEIRTLKSHIKQERRAFRWAEDGTDGKKALIKKSEMKTLINKSPDFTEAWIMREALELIKPKEITNAHRLRYII